MYTHTNIQYNNAQGVRANNIASKSLAFSLVPITSHISKITLKIFFFYYLYIVYKLVL